MCEYFVYQIKIHPGKQLSICSPSYVVNLALINTYKKKTYIRMQDNNNNNSLLNKGRTHKSF